MTRRMLYALPHAVERAADLDPRHEAVRFQGEALSYEELWSRSGRLARMLGEQGVRRGDRVAIYASKGLHSAVAMYGIMRAGAAYVPLDPFAPEGRLEGILRDCGIRHLVTSPDRGPAVGRLAEAAGLDALVGVAPDAVPGLESATWDEVEGVTAAAPDVGLVEQDLSYVLYTSGSTGVPKGVAHTHRSALAYAEITSETYGFRPEDRLANHAPLHFDLSTLDFFSAAVAGATTVIVPESHTRLPASLSKLVEDERMTVLFVVPLALTQLLLRGALDQRDLSSLRWVLFGGEPFPTRHLRGLMKALPHARFSNVYGPTEVNGVTYWIVPPLPDDFDEPIPIGRPFGNAEMRVVGDDDEPVEAGEIGELLVRTPTMMVGYWGRRDLTESATWRRPAQGIVEDRFHRTGDLVRRDPEGDLHFIGRRDRQIKARGYRVELDEVEAALTSHEAVFAAAAVPVPDAEGSQRIHAAATLVEGATATTDAVLAHAALSLPRYAVPERLLLLERLPRTSTGKIDRIAVRELAMEREEADPT